MGPIIPSASIQIPSRDPTIAEVYTTLETIGRLPSEINARITEFCFNPGEVINNSTYNPEDITKRLEALYTAQYLNPENLVKDLAACHFRFNEMPIVKKRILDRESVTVLDVREYKLTLDEIKSLAELFPNAVVYTKYFTREVRNFKKQKALELSQQIKEMIESEQLKLSTLIGKLEGVKSLFNELNANEDLRNKNLDNLQYLGRVRTSLEAVINPMKEYIAELTTRYERVTAELARLSTLSE